MAGPRGTSPQRNALATGQGVTPAEYERMVLDMAGSAWPFPRLSGRTKPDARNITDMPDYDPSKYYVPDYVTPDWVQGQVKRMNRAGPLGAVGEYVHAYVPQMIFGAKADELDLKNQPGALVRTKDGKVVNRYEKAGNVLYDYVGRVGGLGGPRLLSQGILDFAAGAAQQGRRGSYWDDPDDIPHRRLGREQAENEKLARELSPRLAKRGLPQVFVAPLPFTRVERGR